MTLEDCAKLAAQISGHAFMYLQASNATEDRTQKREWLTKAFRSRALADRQWKLLEELAPNCAQAGYADAAMVQEIADLRDFG